MQDLHKIKGLKLFITLFVFIIIPFIGYKYWLCYPAKTPEAAVVKYCKVKSLTYSEQSLKVQETEIIDSDYGNQFLVSGVTGEFGSNILFFYLKNNTKGWKVVSAGTGP